jgi:hypothetical protein
MDLLLAVASPGGGAQADDCKQHEDPGTNDERKDHDGSV